MSFKMIVFKYIVSFTLLIKFKKIVHENSFSSDIYFSPKNITHGNIHLYQRCKDIYFLLDRIKIKHMKISLYIIGCNCWEDIFLDGQNQDETRGNIPLYYRM